VLPSLFVSIGLEFLVINQSTGSITVKASGGATVTTVAANGTARIVSVASAPTTAAHWKVVG
jgi:DNA/RNA endonuclease YhcR with UshA esterase domain